MLQALIISILLTILIIVLILLIGYRIANTNNKSVIIKAPGNEKLITFTPQQIDTLSKAFKDSFEYEEELTIMIGSYLLEHDIESNSFTMKKNGLTEKKDEIKEQNIKAKIEEVYKVKKSNQRSITEEGEHTEAEATIQGYHGDISKEINTEEIETENEDEKTEIKPTPIPKEINTEEQKPLIIEEEQTIAFKKTISNDDSLFNTDKKISLEKMEEFNINN
ncbi:MAG: hypothetical protein JKY54_01670 [Flavobacteriales bacterium]|nr:hypothetical protein [Flavobacteriales bacterium]